MCQRRGNGEEIEDLGDIEFSKKDDDGPKTEAVADLPHWLRIEGIEIVVPPLIPE